MRELLNTLYVTTERSYLHLDHDTIRMEVGGETTFRMPLLDLAPLLRQRAVQPGASTSLCGGWPGGGLA